jgi:hypothetical protein
VSVASQKKCATGLNREQEYLDAYRLVCMCDGEGKWQEEMVPNGSVKQPSPIKSDGSTAANIYLETR